MATHTQLVRTQQHKAAWEVNLKDGDIVMATLHIPLAEVITQILGTTQNNCTSHRKQIQYLTLAKW